jgi:hypothetical protein
MLKDMPVDRVIATGYGRHLLADLEILRTLGETPKGRNKYGTED